MTDAVHKVMRQGFQLLKSAYYPVTAVYLLFRGKDGMCPVYTPCVHFVELFSCACHATVHSKL